MHYVILRDDDTNASTPVECLERLYRPFLDAGLPVNLAVIPNVRTDACRTDGRSEEFLFARNGCAERWQPIGGNMDLVRHLLKQPGFHIVQHGFDHSLFEFESGNAEDIVDRLEQGTRMLLDAGFRRPSAFVAPYDRFSRASFCAAAKRFPVISTGWFELRRLPRSWWLRYAWKKWLRQPHWRVNRTTLLAHPGCLLSRQRPRATMLEEVTQAVLSRRLTVLVTHWWEYFERGQPDEPFITVLHETADWLATEPDVAVITFEEIARGRLPLN